MRLIARGYSYKEIATPAVRVRQDCRDTRVRRAPQAQLSSRHQLTAWANERRLV